jgi:hypothetical protein
MGARVDVAVGIQRLAAIGPPPELIAQGRGPVGRYCVEARKRVGGQMVEQQLLNLVGADARQRLGLAPLPGRTIDVQAVGAQGHRGGARAAVGVGGSRDVHGNRGAVVRDGPVCRSGHRVGIVVKAQEAHQICRQNGARGRRVPSDERWRVRPGGGWRQRLKEGDFSLARIGRGHNRRAAHADPQSVGIHCR